MNKRPQSVIFYSQKFLQAASSKTTALPLVNITVADGIVRSASSNSCNIREGVLISQPRSPVKATVVRAFSVHIIPAIGGYIATSNLSDIYELEETRGDAVRNYLSSLLDELIWLQERKKDLSGVLLQELNRIQSYVMIV